MSRHYPSCICETVTAGDNGRCTVCGNYWKYPVPVSDMTLRDHFAAMAMWSPRNPHNAFDHEAAALWALMEADELLKRLAK
jgi:hypothetical protein